MNPALRILLRGYAYAPPAPPAGVPETDLLWSVVFAAAGAGDDLVIGASDRILMDVVSTPTYGSITNNGLVVVDRTKSTALAFESMTVDGGRYWVGDTANKYPRTYTHSITPSGAMSLDPSLSSPAHAITTANRGILCMNGGEVAWVAECDTAVNVKLADTVAVGATSMTLEEPVTWKQGDKVWLTSTKYDIEGTGREEVTVTSDVNNSVTVPITATLYRHYGRLQYIVAGAHETIFGTNLSETYYPILDADSFGTVSGLPYLGSRVNAAAAAGAHTIIDNRGTACLMTHPIKFQAPNDTDWTNDGYGATLMVMGQTSKCLISGVQMTRVGKAGHLGAYPIHMHMRSYTAATSIPATGYIPAFNVGSGTYLGDVDPVYNYAEKFSIKRSSNRALTIHGTCGFRASSFVAVDIDTHAVFFEDGSEERNTVEDYVVSGVNAIGYGKTAIKVHDALPSCLWYTNPYNRVRNGEHDGGSIGTWNTWGPQYTTSRNVRGTRSGNGVVTFTNAPLNPLYDDPAVWEAEEETITLTALTPTTFARTGSASGPMSGVTVGTAASHGTNPHSAGLTGGWRYTITAGATPFIAGDQFIFDCIVNEGGCLGASRDVAIVPGSRPILEWDGLESHSQTHNNQLTMIGAQDEPGNADDYNPARGVPYYGDGGVSILRNISLWKGNDEAYANFINSVSYVGFRVSAQHSVVGQGNAIRGVAGGDFNGMTACINTLDDAFPNDPIRVMVTYDGLMTRRNGIFVATGQTGMTMGGGATGAFAQRGGVLAMYDFYVYPAVATFANDENNAIIGASPGSWGVMAEALQMLDRWPNLLAYMNATGGIPGVITSTPTSHWNQANAGARKLPADGSLFNRNGWWVNNDPYYTYGNTVQGYAPIPAGALANGDNGVVLSTSVSFFGLYFETTDTDTGPFGPSSLHEKEIHFDRLNPATEAVISSLDYPYHQSPGTLYNMRAVAVQHGGYYAVRWPRTSAGIATLPKQYEFTLYLTESTGSRVKLKIQIDGTTPMTAGIWARYYNTTGIGNQHVTKSANALKFPTKAAWAASTDLGWWLDTVNNYIYLNVDIPAAYTGDSLNNGLLHTITFQINPGGV